MEDLSELLERTWFEDFVRIALSNRFEGVKLIELYELDPFTKELSEVEEIPMAHFDAVRGIIKRRPDELHGWPYKEGQLANHYIQVGKDKDLGLLAKMAPVILSKKLGFGSWLDYVEKYGVGNLFITTDREDAGRLKQLVEAAKNFKASGFMVGRGNEKFEIKGGDAGNPANFDLLIDRANSEMSKRILGGSGITDEKSFVGSAEIQFRMAKDRYDSDRLLLKNVINQQLFPRLAKLSPVYTAFANHYFEWQEEPEDPAYLKDLVTGLAPHFELDIEELSQRLGVQILSQKNNATLPQPEEGDEKKKPRPNVKALLDEITAFYETHHDCGHDHFVEPTALDFGRWDALIDRIAKDLHEGRLKPEDLDSDAINATYSELNQAGRNGYGKDWVSFPGDGKGNLPNELKKNLYMFSGAKTYAMLEQLNGLLYDKDGKLRPYNEYEVFARKLNRQYNRNWLQAEWQTARTAAQMAQKWEGFQKTKDLFPNLEFRTVGDDRVREAHQDLHGIIKPIDDAFWAKYFPPLDWRCRCDAVPTAAGPKGKVPEGMPEPNFKGNVALDGEIFTKKGNFFKLLNSNQNAKRNMELMKLNAPYVKSPQNKKVEVSIFADQRDLKQNVESALKIADNLDIKVQIRAHLDTNIAKGFTNAEYYINGNLSDLKINFEENNYKAISNAFTAAKKQRLSSIVFDFTNSFKNLDTTRVASEMNKNLNSGKNSRYREFIFIYKNNVVLITRENILKNEMEAILKKLKSEP
uniref:phage portal protein family protein n=1 Tax=Aequorivita ciconiae TaxID=2494375 RepID=UPI0013E2AEC4|nr:DUF935 family protein [Aequorivita sp. H23M31]